MQEIKVENPFGVFDYKIIGESPNQTVLAANDFIKALDYINCLPYNNTNTNEQIKIKLKDIEEKYNVKIVPDSIK